MTARTSILPAPQFPSHSSARLSLAAALIGAAVFAFVGWEVASGRAILLVGLSAGLLFLALVLRNIWIGLLAFLFIQPIVPESFGVRVAGVPLLLTAQRFLLFPLFGIWLLGVFLRRPWMTPPRSLFVLVGFSIALRAATALYAPDVRAAAFRVAADSVELLGLFLITADLTSRGNRVRQVLWVWIAASMAASVFGLLGLVPGWNVQERFATNPDAIFWSSNYLLYGFSRSVSLFDHPITYSWFSCIAFLACVTLLFMERRSSRRRLIWIGALASLGSVAASFSRGPIIALVAALVVLVLCSSPRQRGTLARVAIGAAVLLIVLSVSFPAVWSGWSSAVETSLSYQDVNTPVAWSIQGRFSVFDRGMRLIAASPFGFGYTSTTRNQHSSFFYQNFEGMNGFENNYLSAAIQMGIPGVISLSLLLCWILWRGLGSIRARNQAGRDERALATFFVSVTVFHVVLFASTSWMTHTEQLFWVILGAAGGFFGALERHSRAQSVQIGKAGA